MTKKKITKDSKILLCGSLSQYKEIIKVRDNLKRFGFKKVVIPESIKEIIRGKSPKNFSKELFRKRTLLHVKRVKISDAILVVNVKQKGINGYLGANTFWEVGQAFFNNKPVYFFYDIPRWSFYRDELETFKPIALKGNLRNLLK